MAVADDVVSNEIQSVPGIVALISACAPANECVLTILRAINTAMRYSCQLRQIFKVQFFISTGQELREPTKYAKTIITSIFYYAGHHP